MDATESPVTATELADVLKCSVRTVYRMADRGDIPTFKLGREYRFFRSQVLAKLSAPAPAWAQSNRSRGRKRAA